MFLRNKVQTEDSAFKMFPNNRLSQGTYLANKVTPNIGKIILAFPYLECAHNDWAQLVIVFYFIIDPWIIEEFSNPGKTVSDHNATEWKASGQRLARNNWFNLNRSSLLVTVSKHQQLVSCVSLQSRGKVRPCWRLNRARIHLILTKNENFNMARIFTYAQRHWLNLQKVVQTFFHSTV